MARYRWQGIADDDYGAYIKSVGVLSAVEVNEVLTIDDYLNGQDVPSVDSECFGEWLRGFYQSTPFTHRDIADYFDISTFVVWSKYLARKHYSIDKNVESPPYGDLGLGGSL